MTKGFIPAFGSAPEKVGRAPPAFDRQPFRAAVQEIEALDVRVSAQPSVDARPYAIVGGRSNSRWWLLPLGSGRVLAASLALFQPTLRSARWSKQAATALARCGLGSLWARSGVYISGVPVIARHFGAGDAEFAYFTGTDGPHRKLTVQVMGRNGAILGYAKVGSGDAAAVLLQREAQILRQAEGWELLATRIPRVLYEGRADCARLLVTDTSKTAASRSSSRFSLRHLRFVQEMMCVAGSAGGRLRRPYSVLIREQTGALQAYLAPLWKRRLEAAALLIVSHEGWLPPPGYAHGDFTPWNCFEAGEQLYVFDWEHATQQWPSMHDAIYFVLSSPHLRRRSPAAKIAAAARTLTEYFNVGGDIRAHLVLYLAAQALSWTERFSVSAPCGVWDDEHLGSMFDALLGV
ncbi:MAG: hypothetical protein H3C59_01510 [Burkholderiaceae bacterium]|nr:hypothetical protein [Burkholderiaceae bacterium]